MDLKQGNVNLSASGNEMRIGNDTTSKGTLTVEGGTFNLGSTANNVYVNYGSTSSSGAGTLNVFGGTFTARAVFLGAGVAGGGGAYVSGSTASVNVTGGTLYLGAGGLAINTTNTGTLASSIVLSGGIIGAVAAWSSASPMTLTNVNGNITFQAADTNNNPQNITLSGVLSGTLGGLIKTGAGTLTLNNADTYAGNTVISNGVLALGAAGSMASTPLISVGGGASFDVSALGSFTLGSQTLSNNASATGTLNGNLNTGSGTVAVTYASGTPAFNVTNGTLTLSGSTTFKINNTGSALAAGNYRIISKATAGNVGAIGGTLPSVTVTGGGVAASTVPVLTVVAGELYLVVDQPLAAKMTVHRTAGLALRIALSDVATNWSNAAGYPPSLAGINLATTNGVNLLTNSNWIVYTNSPNMNDQISYTISDSLGTTNTGVINVVINGSVTGNTSITQIQTGNPTTLTAYGIPGYSYITERSTNLTTWVDIATNTAATNGIIYVTDSFSDLGGSPPASAYYQLKWQP
jgi:autotransporter-associated beta strand protein